MSIFKRIFRMGSAEANAAVDRMEDPAKMIDESIRELKDQLMKAKQALAEVKTHANRLRTDGETQQAKSEDFGKRAVLVRQAFQAGSMTEQQAMELASKCLASQQAAAAEAQTTLAAAQQQQANATQLQGRISELESQISQAEIKRKTLVARSQAANAQVKINEQLAGINTHGALSTLARMEEKIAMQEARAGALGEMAEAGGGVEAQVDRALAAAGGTGLFGDAKAFLSGGSSSTPASLGSGSAADFLQIPATTGQNAPA